MTTKIGIVSEQYIARKLANSKLIPISEFQFEIGPASQEVTLIPTDAAVLIPLLKMEDEWHVLFTRRMDTLPEHSGQVAFPGGRHDPEDMDLTSTALRETCEEIGLLSKDVKILGIMPKLLTITNYLVTPVVGVIPWPYTLKLSKKEVTRAFTIPLGWLANPENHEIKYRDLPGSSNSIPVVYFKIFDGETLWGASARIILSFIRIIS